MMIEPAMARPATAPGFDYAASGLTADVLDHAPAAVANETGRLTKSTRPVESLRSSEI